MTLFIWFILSWLAGLLTGFRSRPLDFMLGDPLVAAGVLISLLAGLYFVKNLYLTILTVCLLGLMTAWMYMDIRFPGHLASTVMPVNDVGKVVESRDWGQNRVLVITLGREPYRLLVHQTGAGSVNIPQEGDQIHLQAKASLIQGESGLGTFNPAWYWSSHGVRYESYNPLIAIQTGSNAPPRPLILFATGIKNKFLLTLDQMPLTKDNRAILVAMLTGNKQKLDREYKTLFSALGIMHLLAVSGLHLGLVYFLMSFLLRLFRIPEHQLMNQLISISVVWAYAIICDMPPSAFRAASMLTILALFRVFHYKTRSVFVVAATAFFHSLLHPEAVFSAGFQLSYLAVTGILIFYPKIRRLIPKRSYLVNKAVDLAAVSVSAQSLTWPLSVFLFGQFPFWFILSNMFLAPIGILIFYFGLLVTLPDFFWDLPDGLYHGLDVAITMWISLGEILSRIPPGVLTFSEFPIGPFLAFISLLWLFRPGMRFRLVHPMPVLIIFILWGLYGFFNNFVANLLI